MAGSYMDAPSPRLAYDRDGSIGVTVTAAGALTQLTATEMRQLNNESEDTPAFATKQRLALVFPAPVDITHIFLATSASAVTYSIETSKDTTTGIDGTWSTQVAAGIMYLRDVRPSYRIFSALTTMQSGAISQGVRGVRVSGTANTSIEFRGLHVYANPASGATPDRLAFWQPVTNAEVTGSYFDWGNSPRGSSADKTFRIKNMSPDLNAEGLSLYAEALTPGVPSVAGMMLFSEDGVSWSPSLILPDLAPGEITDVLYVRRNVPTNAQVSVWSARMIADVTTWEA